MGERSTEKGLQLMEIWNFKEARPARWPNVSRTCTVHFLRPEENSNSGQRGVT
jgi:hypothetical protein